MANKNRIACNCLGGSKADTVHSGEDQTIFNYQFKLKCKKFKGLQMDSSNCMKSSVHGSCTCYRETTDHSKVIAQTKIFNGCMDTHD